MLHGLGYEHTTLCWSASKIKGDPKGYEDTRKTLVGDSFNCFSFSYVAAQMVNNFELVTNYSQLWERMGMAPGFCSPISVKCPLGRRLNYGDIDSPQSVVDLHRCLLRRVISEFQQVPS